MINSLSIIFPIFNEEKRLPSSLKVIKNFVNFNNFKFLEIIFINDGSKDKSNNLIKSFIKEKKFKRKVKIILSKNTINRGKGFSLKKGVSLSSAEWILTLDIDMSVKLNQVYQWENKKFINNKHVVYFGSRNHKDSKIYSIQTRVILGKFFKILVLFLFNIRLLDTQCGFKLYKSYFGKKLFSRLKSNRFAHDIEIVLICNLMKIVIKELPVTWEHKNNSKLNIFIDPIIMFWNLLVIKKRFLNKI
jgi:dolichyl-phosphate beta-glucosyltransferase